MDVLRDGTPVEVRPITPGDGDRLIRFHESLSAESIRMRFFNVHRHLSAPEVSRFTDVDHHDREALVILVDDDIIGVGRYERTENSEEAEVAFVVADRWQGFGLGRVLLERLAERARPRGIRRFVATTLVENQRMLAVFLHSRFPTSTSSSRGVVSVSMAIEEGPTVGVSPSPLQEPSMSTAPTHFGFTKLLVADLETSATFYRDVFGLKETTRIQSEIAGRALEEILFNPTGEGAATFVLLKFADATTPSANELILGFLTDDVDALIARATAAGATVLREALDYEHLGVRVGFINDLEGHVVEVVQQMA